MTHPSCLSVHSMKCSLGTGDFSIEELVQHILERQRPKPQPRTHTCLCNTAQGNQQIHNITVTSSLCIMLTSGSLCSFTRSQHSSPLQQHQTPHYFAQTARCCRSRLHTLTISTGSRGGGGRKGRRTRRSQTSPPAGSEQPRLLTLFNVSQLFGCAP